jgi:hypothetical protein
MGITLMPLNTTRIGADTVAKVVYLNPKFVIYGITSGGGTSILYKEDVDTRREYHVTETVSTIATLSNKTLLSTQLTRFLGMDYPAAVSVLLNTEMISGVTSTKNPLTGDLTYSSITYNREGATNERFIAAQETSSLGEEIRVLGAIGSTEIIPLGRVSYNHTVGVNDSFQGTNIAAWGQTGGVYSVHRPFKVKRLYTYSNVLPADVAGGGSVNVDLSVKWKTGASSTTLAKVIYNTHTSGSEFNGPESERFFTQLRAEAGQGYIGTSTVDDSYQTLVLKPLESYYYLNCNGGMNQNLSATKVYEFDVYLEVEYV